MPRGANVASWGLEKNTSNVQVASGASLDNKAKLLEGNLERECCPAAGSS